MPDIGTILGSGLVGTVGAFAGKFLFGLFNGWKAAKAAAPQTPVVPERTTSIPDAPNTVGVLERDVAALKSLDIAWEDFVAAALAADEDTRNRVLGGEVPSEEKA